MQLLKVSTAASRIVGPILDSTGAEYASAVIGDISLSKNGGTLTALASAATLTYIANGLYTLALTTGNTDTLGSVEIFCNKSTYQCPPLRATVLSATTFDALVTNAAGAANGIPICGSNAATTFAGLTTGALSCTTVTASGAVAFQSTFAVTTSTSLGAVSGSTLTFSGAVAFQSTFAVTTSTSLAALSCTTLTASGAVAFQSTFIVTGAVTFSSTFATTGTTTFNAFTVTNATTLTGAVSLGSTLGVTGTTTLAALTTGTMTVNAFTCSNNFTVSGNWLTTGTTTWTGAAAFSAGLTSNIIGTLSTVTTATNLTNAPTSGDFTATMKTSIGTAVAASAVASVTAAVTLSAGDSPVFATGTATAGGATTLTDSGASWTVNGFAGCRVKITSGTGPKQSRVIVSNTGTVLTVDRAWATNPSTDSVYAVVEGDAPKTDSSLQTTAASVQGNVTGNVTGSVGSVSGITFPTNFADLAITSSTGKVTVGTNSDKTGYSLANSSFVTATFGTCDFTTTMKTSLNAATPASVTGNIGGLATQAKTDVENAVWDAAESGHTTAGTFGLFLDATVSSRSQLTAAGVWASATRTLSAFAFTVSANLTQIKGTTVPETNAGQVVANFGEFYDVTPTSTKTVNDVGGSLSASDVWSYGTRVLTAGTNIVLPSGGLANVTAWTVALTGNVTGNLSGSVGSVTNRVTANTDQLAGQTVTAAAGVTFPTSVASPTNITAGTVTTVTTLTNLPAVTTDWLTAAGVKADAVTKIQAGLSTYAGGAVASVTAGVTLAASQHVIVDSGTVTVSDKTGFVLASTGLDQISAAEPTAKPTTFAGWVMWLVQRFRRSTLTSTQLKTLKEDGTTITTQTVSDDATTQALGPPS